TKITLDSNAYVVHQVIEQLRAGKIGGTSFSKVILVGHSLGSITSIITAGKYGGVDGLMLTGFLHPFNVAEFIKLVSGMKPARFDPVFKKDKLPSGYLSIAKQTRKLFYNLDNIDPKILDIDN